MKKLICLALLMIVGCGCCTKTVHIFHDRNNPDDSMGVIIVPVPKLPVPMPDPKMPPFYPPPKSLEADPWCLLFGMRRA